MHFWILRHFRERNNNIICILAITEPNSCSWCGSSHIVCVITQMSSLCLTRVCWGWNWILTPRTENSPTDVIFRSAFSAVWKNRTTKVDMTHLETRDSRNIMSGQDCCQNKHTYFLNIVRSSVSDQCPLRNSISHHRSTIKTQFLPENDTWQHESQQKR